MRIVKARPETYPEATCTAPDRSTPLSRDAKKRKPKCGLPGAMQQAVGQSNGITCWRPDPAYIIGDIDAQAFAPVGYSYARAPTHESFPGAKATGRHRARSGKSTLSRRITHHISMELLMSRRGRLFVQMSGSGRGH